MNKPVIHILLFDGECRLCNRLVIFIVNRDPYGKFSFAPLNSEPGRYLLKKYGYSENETDSVIYIRGNNSYKYADAVIELLRDLGKPWRIFSVLFLIPASVRNFIYRLIAKNRFRIFGKYNSCIVPSSNIKSRFLNYLINP